MNKTLRPFLVTAAVMTVGSPALAQSSASLRVFPDIGAPSGKNRIQQDAQGGVFVPTAARVSAEADAAMQAQLRAALKALGIAVD